MENNLNSKIVNATKWSAVTELLARLIGPITSIVLARLLTPDAFGVVATITMIISFAEIFTDAGFQKYLIQHEFIDSKNLIQCTNVAFWSNFVVSIIIWGIIILFSNQLAVIVGNPDLGHVLIISCISIPISAFSSIQTALYKRHMDFRTLFKVRLVALSIPLFVTIPCAVIFRNYWALVVGTLVTNIINAVLLTIYSSWKPSFYFSFSLFREMFSFTSWSLIEAISIWLTTYVDVFIIGVSLNEYYLGLYKTSMTTVGQITGLITSATTPILFSTLSRLQNNDFSFNDIFFKFQKIVGLLVIPMGVGICIFSDLVTTILLGSQWTEAAYFLGLWGLTSSFTIVLAHYSSEVYRAKGKPKLSVFAQWLHIIVLWPTVLLSVRYGFEVLCVTRAIVRLELVLVQILIMKYFIGMDICKMFNNILPACLASISMFLIFLLPSPFIIWQELVYVIICIIIYFLVLSLFPAERKIILNLRTILKS